LIVVALQGQGPALDPPPVATVPPPDTTALTWWHAPPPLIIAAPPDTNRGRPRAIEYSDMYGVRLEIHRYASYATIPLFVGEYALGQSLINHPPGTSAARNAHSIVAYGLAGLFGVNTVTGVWNLWESRHDPADRPRKYIHAALMMLSDAGFVATGATAPGRRRITADPGAARVHKELAIGSMAVALGGYLMMLVWKK
jgi:hypothetical protein